MMRTLLSLGVLATLGSVNAQNASINSITDAVTGKVASWLFTPVRSIRARVQGNLPIWDAEHKMYVSEFGADFNAKYNGVLDTVNMASVEGSLKYVQAECINYKDVKDLNCQRKNNIKYIVMYETIYAQPRAATAVYQLGKSNSVVEYCQYLPMDGGQCTPTNGVLPTMCNEYVGIAGSKKLGFCIGGELRESEYLAPYPDTYWFSFPNSCPTKVWAEKSEACRTEQAGGVCPPGVKPDGIKCSFSFKILGWINLDDVVGITSMTNPITNQPYKDYNEFCQAGGIEYKVNTDNNELTVEETIPFWADPANPEANRARGQKIIETYNAKIKANPKSADGGVMQILPTLAALRRENPPCYKNNLRCALSFYGCRRKLLTQVCEICTKSDYSPECVVAPADFKFPKL
ncbi:hypothetical protein Poli38472_004822 [Pythium oligandrum]|uniref:Uncharacterized protein n=1 Tax=Pythium oligandrum TaxID=41045 RepID=A0A8K1CBS0_PYTOL|nr:hypothetical protein Poli38472_004822 [Pythium oligandrum]|eukprot:TMW59753.1 hypothetical protein Poli38472_004822 [Pythium oligandrum]